MLAQLLRDATQHQGSHAKKAVISVPAYFDDWQRDATIEVGEDARHISAEHHQSVSAQAECMRCLSSIVSDNTEDLNCSSGPAPQSQAGAVPLYHDLAGRRSQNRVMRRSCMITHDVCMPVITHSFTGRRNMFPTDSRGLKRLRACRVSPSPPSPALRLSLGSFAGVCGRSHCHIHNDTIWGVFVSPIRLLHNPHLNTNQACSCSIAHKG